MPTTTLSSSELTRDDLIDLFYDDANKFAISDSSFPACPQGGKCECPRVKGAEKFCSHKCLPDPKSGCIVRITLFPQGTR